jgi:hypothetical protein
MDNRAKIDIAGKSAAVTPPTPAPDGRLGFAHWFTSWLRDPSWLTVQRVTFYSGVLLLAYLAAAIAQLFHSHHMILESGNFVGGDFVVPYAASIAALKGDAASVYDIHRVYLQEAAVMGAKDFGGPFMEPPMYLLIVLPLSMLPLIASWVVFETVTLGGYLAVLRRIAPIPVGLWLAITFPAVIINSMCGQNGFLTTALIGGGLLLLDRWPLLAGFLFGLMAYKPHLAILIPLALIAGRRWRALIATAISTGLFAAASLAVFGTPAWRAFVGSVAFTQKTVLERGLEGGGTSFATMQTIFGAIRMWGGSVEVAYVFQVVGAICAASAVVWIWQSSRPFALKAATVAVGCLMVSPYLLQYELVLLALPIAWLAMEGFEKGFLPYEKAVLSVAWILPRVSLPVSQSAKIPIAPIVIIALLTAILRRASYREPAAHQDQALHLADFETPAPLLLPGLGQSS